MTGKRYYITTLGAWQRYAVRFANSHFITLNRPPAGGSPVAESGEGNCDTSNLGGGDATLILVLVESDEGVHLTLEDESTFEALPHPLAQKPISDAAQAALARYGVAPGANTFDAAEAVARVHPLLRHRVF